MNFNSLMKSIKNLFKTDSHVNNIAEHGIVATLAYNKIVTEYPSRLQVYVSRVTENMILSYFVERGIIPQLSVIEHTIKMYKMSKDFYMALTVSQYWDDSVVKPTDEHDPIAVTKVEFFFIHEEESIKRQYLEDIENMTLPLKEIDNQMELFYYVPNKDLAGNIHFKPVRKVIKTEIPKSNHYADTEIMVGKESLTLDYDELCQWISLSIDSSENVIISGPPGTGKSRLALYICSEFSKNNDYAVIMTNAQSAIDFFTKPDFISALEQIRKDNILLYIEDGDAFLSQVFVNGKKTTAGSAILSMTSGTSKELLNISIMMTSNEDLSQHDEMVSERFNVQVLVPKISIDKAKLLINDILLENPLVEFNQEGFDNYIKGKNKISLREIYKFFASLDKSRILRMKIAEAIKKRSQEAPVTTKKK